MWRPKNSSGAIANMKSQVNLKIMTHWFVAYKCNGLEVKKKKEKIQVQDWFHSIRCKPHGFHDIWGKRVGVQVWIDHVGPLGVHHRLSHIVSYVSHLWGVPISALMVQAPWTPCFGAHLWIRTLGWKGFVGPYLSTNFKAYQVILTPWSMADKFNDLY